MDTSWAIYELDKTEIFKTHLNDVFKVHMPL